MNYWICPVRPKSWKIVKKKRIFGTSKKSLNTMQKLRAGDILYFHVFKPVNGIVAKARVVSEFFVDNENIWGKDLYPYRVKIEVIEDLLAEKKQPIPLSYFFDNAIDKEITIEPYLRNVSIIKITECQSNLLSKLMEED